MIVKSVRLPDRAVVLDLKDYERALVWIDGRFSHVLPPGLYAYWTGCEDVRVEVVDARTVRFEHADLPGHRPLAACRAACSTSARSSAHHVGVLFLDGDYVETLPPGHYAFWKNVGDVEGGRGRPARDDARRRRPGDHDGRQGHAAHERRGHLPHRRRAAGGHGVGRRPQALYREAQLALRAVVGARELDAFLADKDAVASELEEAVRRRAGELGLEIVSVGIRDVILPGEMKDLMNKVTEAKKAAEANLIVRREETAAMRSQANTAKLLADNPTLMRLRELEVLEKIAASGKLNVVLGEKGLADRVVNLL